MDKFTKLFRNTPAIIGMIHVRPLPGSPCYKSGSFDDVVRKAEEEARVLLRHHMDGIIIENMHDVPYLNRSVGPEVTSSMSIIAQAVRNVAKSTPCGIQILSGCNREALAVAKAASLDFIRAEGFVFAHVGDEGITQSDAGSLLRYRKYIDAENVLIFTDVKKKHCSHAITQDISFIDVCQAVEMFLSEAIVITGLATGKMASVDDLDIALDNTNLPSIIGSGITDENFHQFSGAQALIIGSHFKKQGFWKNELSEDRISRFMDVVNSFRKLRKT